MLHCIRLVILPVVFFEQNIYKDQVAANHFPNKQKLNLRNNVKKESIEEQANLVIASAKG